MARCHRYLLPLSIAVALTACSGNAKVNGTVTSGASTGGSSGGTSGGSTGTTTGGHPDSGVDAGPGRCSSDFDCYGEHGVCSDGGCVPASEGCQPRNLGNDCSVFQDCQDNIGNPICYCRPDPSSDAGGFCYPPQPACGSCQTSQDCGSTASQLLNSGFCLPLDGGSFCLPTATSGCGAYPGFILSNIDAGFTVCSPICDTCPCSAGCNNNADCQAIDAGVCGESKLCIPPCHTQSECGPGQVCNVLDKYLDPGLTLAPDLSPLYGGGACGSPCVPDAGGACLAYESTGGVALACITDPTETDGPRCRVSGCLNAQECTNAPTLPDGSYVPWCDVFNGNLCVGDSCRLGLDGGGDCLGGFYCIADGGKSPGANGSPATGECVAEPCYFQGALVDCPIDELCCGEGDAGPATCPAGVTYGACYKAPNPPWCASCDPTNGNFGIAACERAASALQFGTGLGTSFCQPTMGGGICEPACVRGLASSCATGFTCTDQTIVVSACSACGSNPCQDAGYNPATGSSFVCACVDSVGTGCPGQGQVAVPTEVPTCSSCPEPDGGCVPATDGLGFNCTPCTLGDTCPAATLAGASVPSVCAPLAGVSPAQNACGLLQPVACNPAQFCSFGTYCSATPHACQ